MQIDRPETADEARIIRDIVSTRLNAVEQAGGLPPKLRPGFDIEFGEDTAGEPAVWVWLHVADGPLPPWDEVVRMSQLGLDLERELIDAGLAHVVYVDIRPGS